MDLWDSEHFISFNYASSIFNVAFRRSASGWGERVTFNNFRESLVKMDGGELLSRRIINFTD